MALLLPLLPATLLPLPLALLKLALRPSPHPLPLALPLPLSPQPLAPLLSTVSVVVLVTLARQSGEYPLLHCGQCDE